MGNLIKTTLVFMGGMTAGGFCIVNAVLKSQIFSTALKDVIANKVVEAVYGKECARPRQKSYASYYDIYSNNHRAANHNLESCDDVLFQTRKEAEDTLNAMTDIAKQYGFVSLADVYEIAGITTTTYTASKYGWTSVDNGKVVRCRDGYFIKLPNAEEIK